jgi:hypothetical protein
MYACSPQWAGDWISREDLEECLDLLAASIVPSPWGPEATDLSHGLHFSGGEPFLDFDLLSDAVAIAEELKIPSTFVETNCFWCSSDETTREKLRHLRDRGLKGIMISVNPYYAEYVPFERTERCVRLSREVFGRNTMVYQMEYYARFRELGVRNRLAPEEYSRMAGDEDLAQRVEMFLMGRAVHRLKDGCPSFPAEVFYCISCQPPFLRDWHNHFDNYGNFMPGFCGGISLGFWRDIDRLATDGLDLESHPVLDLLISGDMQGLHDLARGLGFQEEPGGYVSKCHLCLEIRGFLHSRQDFAELAPAEFYQQLGY